MEQQKTDWFTPLALFVVTLLSRLPFTSKLLYNLDSVHFALALEKFDVYLHQPHPPGYFLYVMMGKAIHLFVEDANTSYLVISLIASGLTVVAVYYSGKALFNHETGWWAALFALTSPLIWFHGEVALNYILAAFFNTWIAILCWKLLRHEHKWLYLSSVILGIAAGIRQDLLIFLLPLWFFCIKDMSWQKILSAVIVLGVTIASWFMPMLILTGGVERYFSAVQEQWDFFNSKFAIWNSGLGHPIVLLSALGQYILYGTGIGIVFIVFALYTQIRTGLWRRLSMEKVTFFLLWLVPAFLFDVFIFMHPASSGVGLFFIPPLLVLLYPSIVNATLEMIRVLRNTKLSIGSICSAASVVLIVINAAFFLSISSPVSASQIRQHDHDLCTLLSGIENNFSPDETIIYSGKPYQLFSYRHIMYYLPEYRAYLANTVQNDRGERWHVFGGVKRQTFLDDAVRIPVNTRYVVHFIDPSDRKYGEQLEAMGFKKLFLEGQNMLYYEEIKR